MILLYHKKLFILPSQISYSRVNMKSYKFKKILETSFFIENIKNKLYHFWAIRTILAAKDNMVSLNPKHEKRIHFLYQKKHMIPSWTYK